MKGMVRILICEKNVATVPPGEECVAENVNNKSTSNCNFATSVVGDVGRYINNEGNREMQESKCEIHLAACQRCIISKQVSPAGKK